jgi:transposase
MQHRTKHLAGWVGILQDPSRGLQANHCRAVDAYGGYNELYSAEHKPSPALRALCWSHARRKFFELADIKATARFRYLRQFRLAKFP